MTRVHLILACVVSAVLATNARAQSPYGPGAMPPGMIPNGPMSPDAQMSQGTYPPAAQYHAKMPAPPPIKLPPGVKSDNGLLYYNGNAYGDVNPQGPQQFNPYQNNSYQNNPYQNNPYQYGGNPNYPNQQVAYQEAMQAGMQGGPMQGGPMQGGPMQGGPMQGGPMQGGQMQGGPSVMSQGMQGGGYEGSGMGGCNGNCGGNGDGDAGCSDCDQGSCHGWLFNCMHGLPGKEGYNWTFGADALAMTRSTGVAKPLIQDVTTGATLFNTNQWNFDYEGGVRTFLNLTTPSGITYQGVYMDIPRMGDSTVISSPNNLQIPFPLASDTVDFFGADQMVVRYDSRFQSAEANAIFPWGNFQFLAGYRWVRLHETSTIESFDFDDGDVSDYTVDSSNNLNGGQIGIVGEWEFMGHISFDFFAKTGVFANTSTEHQTLGDFGNTITLRDVSGTRTDVAYVSELAAQVVIPLGSVFSIQGGYRVLFLNQMALAPGQFDFTDNADSGTHVNSSSNVVLHGANLGLTAKW